MVTTTFVQRLPHSALLLLVLAVLSSFSNQAYARWQTFADANNEIEFYTKNVLLNQDGTSTETIEIQVKILKESGRNIWANFPLVYNAATSKLTVLAAKTIYAGQEYPLDAKLIEDKPLASSPQGFDQYNQVALAYPNAEINSKLYLKYQIENHTAELPNYFADNFVFGESAYWSNGTVNIKSALPLYLAINDPDQVLTVTTKNKKIPSATSTPAAAFTDLTITLQQPIYRDIIDEKHYLVDPKKLPWVAVSSVKSWQVLANKVGTTYMQVINQPLPELFQVIAKQAKQHADHIDKINTVTALLAEKLQYMGDWKTVAGKFFPHDLAHIAKVQLGDCKDFTVSAGAILQSLGYKVQPALILRGMLAYSPPNDLPSLRHANHVLLKVTLPAEQQVLWIDPTNFVSMAGGIFPDIANKKVLIIDPNAAQRETTPATSPARMQFLVRQEFDLGTPDLVKAHGTLKLLGEQAASMTGAQMLLSDEAIKSSIFNFVGDQYLEADKEIILPDLTSRIVGDLQFKFSYEQALSDVKTNLGSALLVPNTGWSRDFIEVKADQVSDIFVGPPSKIKFVTTIKNFLVTNPERLADKFSTKWLNVERKIEPISNGVIITDEVDIKVFFISNAELRSRKYSQLKQRLVKNFRSVAIVGEYLPQNGAGKNNSTS